MAQFEIEIKLPLKNLKETLKFLTDQGFQETAQIQEEDTYFNSVYHDVKKRDEALRIRTSTDCRSGISKTQINFKGPKLDKISMSRMELETEVSDAEVLKNILIHLDFQIFPLIFCISKLLHLYTYPFLSQRLVLCILNFPGCP